MCGRSQRYKQNQSVDSRQRRSSTLSLYFFFNDTATTEIYTLSLHDALPISLPFTSPTSTERTRPSQTPRAASARGDRKSTRLNSSHMSISYAVFCLKKKKTTNKDTTFKDVLPINIISNSNNLIRDVTSCLTP